MATPLTQSAVEFPVDWSTIQVSGQPFTLDSLHAPAPTVPLEATAAEWIGAAFADGFRAHGIPMRAAETMYVNHYSYSRMLIDQPTAEQIAAIEQTVRDVIAIQMDRWYGEYLPRVESLITTLKAFDADSPALADLPARLDAMDAAQAELWAVHFRIVVGMLLSMQGFGEFYAELFQAPEQEAYELLAGGLTESMNAGLVLADLAERARELGLDTVILQASDGDVIAALTGSPGGDGFLVELDGLLKRYGYRQDLYHMTEPTWLEQPSRAIGQILANLRGEVDVRTQQLGVARAAEAATKRAREHLMSYPKPVCDQFEAMLTFARQGAFLEEEHHFYIDQHSMALLRLTYLKVGQRLRREGLLDNPEDIMMLRLDELRSILLDAAGAGAVDSVRSLVRDGRRELDLAATMTPPPFLGEPTSMGEPSDNIFARALRNHFGGPPAPSERPGELRGMPASRGVATGRARIARSLREAQALAPGEILVTVTTMPSWTPLFGIAAAVVTETGGALSHCAIAAREYGIPAVVGMHGATHEIVDGAMVTVDGAAGTVLIGA